MDVNILLLPSITPNVLCLLGFGCKVDCKSSFKIPHYVTGLTNDLQRQDAVLARIASSSKCLHEVFETLLYMQMDGVTRSTPTSHNFY